MLGPFGRLAGPGEGSGSRRSALRAGGLALALLLFGGVAISDESDRQQSRDKSPEIGFDLGLTSFDNPTLRETFFRLSARAGWHFSDHYQLELQHAYAENSDGDDREQLQSTFLNAIVNFHPSETVSPYLLVGAGHIEHEVGPRGRSGSAGQVGAGSRFSLWGSERVSGRIEALIQRGRSVDLDSHTNFSLTGGITWRPGRRALPGAVEGRLRAGDGGRPLAGVGVRLSSAGQEIGTSTSDAEGLFRFEELEAGSYEVGLDTSSLPADNWIEPAAATAAVQVVAGETATIDFSAPLKEAIALSAAESAGAIDGRVAVDADGDGEADPRESPIGGLEVLLSGEGKRRDKATTGADGNFDFGPQAPGTYEVEASAEGLPARYRVDEALARKLVVVPFGLGLTATESWGDITGVVRVDENGNGVAEETERGLGGVGIEIASEGRPVGEVETTDDGTFGLGMQPPGEYLISVSDFPSGYGPGKGSTSIEIFVPPSLGLLAEAVDGNDGIVGRVWVDADDNGRRGRDELSLAGIGIDLGFGGRSIGSAVTDRTGGFRLGSEGAGRYTVSIDAASVPAAYRVGRGMSPRYVTLIRQVAVGMSLAESAGAISGKVWADLDENGLASADEPPIADAEVALGREETELAAARTNREGVFELGTRKPGRYRVDLVDSTLPAGHFVGPGASPQFVEVPELLGSITVLVWVDDNLDDQVQPGERVFPNVDAQLLRDGRIVSTGQTGAGGGWVFDDLEPGPYEARLNPATLDEEFRIGLGVLPKQITLAPDQDAVAAFQVRAQEEFRISWIIWLILFLLAVYLLIHLLLRKRRFGRMLAPCWLPWPPGDRKKSKALLRELQEMRKPGARKTLEKLNSIRGHLGKLTCARPKVVTELFLAYRGVRGWSEMYEMVEQMAPALAVTPLVLQQKAFALNRDGRGEEAEKILTELREKDGPSPETNGILGRVYKDRWETAADEAQLRKSLDTYLEGHRADPSDPYPGINALTLMESFAVVPAEREALLGEVKRAVGSRKKKADSDYWSSATRLELAVLTGDEAGARSALETALAAGHDVWQAESTARNLKLIQAARGRHGRETPAWVGEIVTRLEAGVTA